MECLWTYSRMLKKTIPYCIWMGDFDNDIWIGWWMSEDAVEDMDKFLWLN